MTRPTRWLRALLKTGGERSGEGVAAAHHVEISSGACEAAVPPRPLPTDSTLLSGREPGDHAFAWQSDQLQVWFNNSAFEWTDERPHAHRSSDEVFVVLEGTVVVEVEGRRVSVGPNEFCCFPAGLAHQIVETRGPLRTLMLRSPSVEDKVLL